MVEQVVPCGATVLAAVLLCSTTLLAEYRLSRPGCQGQVYTIQRATADPTICEMQRLSNP